MFLSKVSQGFMSYESDLMFAVQNCSMSPRLSMLFENVMECIEKDFGQIGTIIRVVCIL